MTRDTTDRRTHRRRTPYRSDDRETDRTRRARGPDAGAPLVPETATGDDTTDTYRAAPFELALMEDSE